MSVIDLDKTVKVDNKSTIKLAGKEYNLTFNDDFREKVTITETNVSKIIKKLNSDKFSDYVLDLSADKRKETIANLINDLKRIATTGLDELLGEGVGQQVWEYYNGSTDAVSAVIGALENAADKAVEIKENQNRAQRRAKYQTER